MPARMDVGVLPGHSLALFATDHTARNEVDWALALVADLGAAADVHQFRLSMRWKQELFARMRDLDVAWNDWLAGAEEIDQRSELILIISTDLHLSPFHPVHTMYPPLPVAIPLYAVQSCMGKSHKTVSVSTATRITQRDYALNLTSCVRMLRVAMFLSTTRALEPCAQGISFIRLGPSRTIVLIPNEYDTSKKQREVELAGLRRG
ncbi:hypothetical protein EDB87DRAFT_1583256 [Lactarius vividus]|nr:hypothetical protein EDB87DRAFT_1583256 [Lactarius vividus]